MVMECRLSNRGPRSTACVWRHRDRWRPPSRDWSRRMPRSRRWRRGDHANDENARRIFFIELVSFLVSLGRTCQSFASSTWRTHSAYEPVAESCNQRTTNLVPELNPIRSTTSPSRVWIPTPLRRPLVGSAVAPTQRTHEETTARRWIPSVPNRASHPAKDSRTKTKAAGFHLLEARLPIDHPMVRWLCVPALRRVCPCHEKELALLHLTDRIIIYLASVI